MYYKHGTQLRFKDEIDYQDFNYKIGTPTQIKILSNRNLYGDSPVQTEEVQIIHYEPTNTWDHFVSTQSPWIQKLLEGIQFQEDVPTPFDIFNE